MNNTIESTIMDIWGTKVEVSYNFIDWDGKNRKQVAKPSNISDREIERKIAKELDSTDSGSFEVSSGPNGKIEGYFAMV